MINRDWVLSIIGDRRRRTTKTRFHFNCKFIPPRQQTKQSHSVRMPLPLAAAARAASAAGNVGATALGIGMGKTDLELTQDLFKLQMRQAKRLWTADFAESSIRHGESCMQSAQQHAEAQAMASAAYFQAEKINSQNIKLARDQDARAYELVWRAEVRESLRDELQNQNNRFNIVMLCDTVCLSCLFSLIADGSPPIQTPVVMLNAYVLCLGLSIAIFTISIWCSVIVVRRLYEHTASDLERKLFAQSKDLQRVWKQQLQMTPIPPSGQREMHLVTQAYEHWLAEHIDPIAQWSIFLMSVGVVAMFITAGLLLHNQYVIDYSAPMTVPGLFWSTVFLTSTLVICMKFSEDRKEKKKLGVYDSSWQDTSSFNTGPFAKINSAAEQLFSRTVKDLASADRMQKYENKERTELVMCSKTTMLHDRVDSLRKESESRAKTRKDVLRLLTTAAEELDALPEELTSQLNKLLHEIDESDQRTADLVTVPSPDEIGDLKLSGSQKDVKSFKRLPPTRKAAVSLHPIDAQRIPVSLTSLRHSLGEIPLTTLLRIKNMSDEPLRLRSGVQLKDGKYVKSIKVNDPDTKGNNTPYHLYPGTEIPPRTEVVIVARSKGGRWIATSGIDGELVYTNRSETWNFRVRFTNERFAPVRRCDVMASRVSSTKDDDEDDYVLTAEPFWHMSREELDRKQNNEVIVSIDSLHGDDATKAALGFRQSQTVMKEGMLLKNFHFGLRLQWHQRWVKLSPTEIIIKHMGTRQPEGRILLQDIVSVEAIPEMAIGKQDRVFEIQTTKVKGNNNQSNESYKFCAASQAERDDWIQLILAASSNLHKSSDNSKTSDDADSFCHTSECMEEGIECVMAGSTDAEVLPPI
jgi:hypothetical protein